MIMMLGAWNERQLFGRHDKAYKWYIRIGLILIAFFTLYIISISGMGSTLVAYIVYLIIGMAAIEFCLRLIAKHHARG